MNITVMIIPVIFIMIILKQVRYIKKLIIPARKSYAEIITVLFSVGVFIWITYFYAHAWSHYVIAVLGTFVLLSMCLKEGIISEGFVSMYKYKEIILWNEIEKVMIITSKDIKIKVSGGFMQQTFRFKKTDYDKVITILKENLPIQAELQIK
ncbi:hypothetical protein RBU49_05180 [Clostridium sp. MB40-C1]|uniref:hypothetical protein n=1 Tax=Clostridium sp. MB40-C1 TaxID=3070996 RepID=UPI0027DFDA9A|nr:hypothetical protein [Clostridium sp. MB40-C1]WMJ81643.1 hypothetical protein RBU49_05180 [Clostridium sp. MB40-C1]